MADRSSRDVLRLAATVAGVLLAGGVFGLIAEWFGTAETIGLLGFFCLAGAVGATRLDEVTR